VAALLFLLQRLGCTFAGAVAGTLFFALNPAVLQVYWRPMYVYDATAGLFCALALLAWSNDRWVIAFVCYWLAMRAKESAVMLPLVLVAFEGFIGGRRWKRVFPFAVLGGAMILVAFSMNKAQPPDYRFHFKLRALQVAGYFYVSALFGIPVLGIAVLGLPLVSRDRRVWFGCAAFFAMLAPLLFLTGRLFSAYLYVPLLGLAVAAGALIERPRTVAWVMAIWLAWTAFVMRRNHRPVFEAQHDTATYMETLRNDIRSRGAARVYAVEGFPEMLHPWGVVGLLRLLAPGSAVDAASLQPGTRVLEWKPAQHRLEIRDAR
jgi:MFS family permease